VEKLKPLLGYAKRLLTSPPPLPLLPHYLLGLELSRDGVNVILPLYITGLLYISGGGG